jgi:GntR family transcriptional regulator/MocR family aminotransferase
MPRKPLVIEIPALGALDAAPGEIGRRLAEALRGAILKGELKARERVPSTRSLAGSLGLARGTVSVAYAQLVAEGYLEARIGSATRVAADLHRAAAGNGSDARRKPAPHRPSPLATANATPPATSAYAALATRLSALPSVPFSIAVPEGEVAMDHHWHRLSKRIRATPAAAPSGYPDAQGLPALRTALADYLRKSRAVDCDPDHIIITEGTQQGLYLAAKVLLQAGDFAWAEDPAYSGLTAVLEDRGVQVQRVPVDHQGFNVAAALQSCPQAKAAFVTPSHQYPIGMPLSMARRIALTDWAASHNTWIVEDDYDSELRYAGQPFPAMQGLDRAIAAAGLHRRARGAGGRLHRRPRPDRTRLAAERATRHRRLYARGIF